MIYIIGIGPGGSAKYLTARALEVISNVDEAIYVGQMIGPEIRDIFPADRLKVGQLPIPEVQDALQGAAANNRSLAILVPGDPALYSGQDKREKTLGEYVAWLRSEGLEFEIVPGISSWMALCASAGLDMTEFGTSQSTVVVSLERMRGVSADKTINWVALGKACESKPALVLFQSYAERAVLPDFLAKYYPPESEVIVGYKVSWPDEKILRMPLSSLAREKLGDNLSKHSIIIILPPKSTP